MRRRSARARLFLPRPLAARQRARRRRAAAADTRRESGAAGHHRGRGAPRHHRFLHSRGSARPVVGLARRAPSREQPPHNHLPAGLWPRRVVGHHAGATCGRAGLDGGALLCAAPRRRTPRPGDAGAERRPCPRPALGTHRGELRRGPAPCRGHDRGHRARPTGSRPPLLARGVADEAFPGQQQRVRPRQLVERFRRAPVPRLLFLPLHARHHRGRLARVHGILQQLERHAHGHASLPRERCAP